MADLPPPTPSPCRFVLVYRGRCGETDRTKCRHNTTEPCRGCGRPALGECAHAGQFVCGAPICTENGACIHHGGRCR